MARESQVSPRRTTLRPLMGGTTRDLMGSCSPLGSCTTACGPCAIALCTASCSNSARNAINAALEAPARKSTHQETFLTNAQEPLSRSV